MTPRRGIEVAGFLILLLGILMVSSLSAAPLDDALEELDALEGERTRILTEADSAGRAISALPEGAEAEIARFLRTAEELAEQARDLDLEILLARQRCRSLALQELDRLQGSNEAPAFAREAAILDLLDRRLADQWGSEPVFVEPDSLDGYETLLDKQAYLADLQDRIEILSSGLDRRIDSARREQALRRESERFADEARFLDEGGRLGSDDRVPLRGVPGDGPPGDGNARSLPSGGAGSDPEASPTDPFTSNWIGADGLDPLEATRSRLQQDLSRVARALRATEDFIERYENPTR